MYRLVVGIVIGLLCTAGIATAKPQNSGAFWVPVWDDVRGAVWTFDAQATHRATWDGRVFAVAYAKQPEHTAVKLCGMVSGTGAILLAYGGAGDAVTFREAQPQFRCVQTTVGPGGGAGNVQVEVYLHAETGDTLTLSDPTLLLQVTPQ
jgi:hypothetical protein